jgi:hypothetical protein
MLSLLKTLLETLNLYFKLKNKSFYRDLLESSKRKQKDLINEIEKLRANGDSDSTDRADFLQSELIAEKRDVKHLSTIYAPSESGSASSD